MRFALLITAAGSSARFGAKKEFLDMYIRGKRTTVLAASLETFLKTGFFSLCVVTVPAGGTQAALSALASALKLAAQKNIPVLCTEGGNTRQESVYKGLQLLEKQNEAGAFDAVMIHDGARPWVTAAIIADTANTTEKHGAAVPAVESVDTCKEADETGKIIRHLRRSAVFAVQTPQSFLFKPLLEAHKKAAADGRTYTDDTEIWAAYEGDVYISRGDRCNKKITFREDLLAAEEGQK